MSTTKRKIENNTNGKVENDATEKEGKTLFDPKNYIPIIIVAVVIPIFGYLFVKTNQYEARLSIIETRLQYITLLDEKMNNVQKTVDQIKAFPLTNLNMNKDQNLEKIELANKFHIEWDKGPSEKVFQIYKDGKMIQEKRVRNGTLISLSSDINGQCEIKTWWDNGTMEREEIWVYINNN